MNKTTLSRIFLHGLIFISVFSFAGCGPREDIAKVNLDKTEELKSSAKKAAAFRIGLIPEQNVQKMAERYEPLARYLSRKLDLKVTLIYLDNYGEVCDKFIYKQLDAAFFGSFSYALTRARAGIEPIARPEYEGVSTYRGLVIVREDSPIRKIQDMKGKRLVLVHRATYAGYLYPLYYFKTNGVTEFETYFSKVVFEGSHDKAVSAVLRKESDVAVAKDFVYERMLRENADLGKRLIVLAASEPVPSNALCASKELDPAIKAKLRKVLIGMADDEAAKPVLESLGGVSRFVETKDADYRALYTIVKFLNIDLNTYPYYERPDIGFMVKDDI